MIDNLIFLKSNDPKKYKNIREFIPDFYSVFPVVKRLINQIIFKEHSVFDNHLKRPFVDVQTIVRQVGINMIWQVPKEVIGGRHAIISYDNINGCEWTVIFLNKDDSQGEKNFSLGHEAFHYIFGKIYQKNILGITEKINTWTEQLLQKYKEKAFILRKDYDQTRKHNSLPYKTGIAARIDSKEESPKKRDPNNIEDLKMDIADDVENEIADYFAANLVVPVERFILWRNKSTSKIARAFKVEEKCIKKRMTEIPSELEYLKSLDTGLEE
jgi:hypothetical protein